MSALFCPYQFDHCSIDLTNQTFNFFFFYFYKLYQLFWKGGCIFWFLSCLCPCVLPSIPPALSWTQRFVSDLPGH